MMTNPGQGQFSFLPDLTDAEISLQIEYGLKQGYAWSVEYTDDPHPRNTYWEMYGMPMFDLNDAAGVLAEVNACRQIFPEYYIRLMAFDSSRVLSTGQRVNRDLGYCGRKPKGGRYATACAVMQRIDRKGGGIENVHGLRRLNLLRCIPRPLVA